MKKEAYFFYHDSNARNDEKILSLRMDYGWEGYGLFWAIIEIMRDASGYKLSRLKINELNMMLNLPKIDLGKFVDDCINNYKLFNSEQDNYYSNRLLANMRRKQQISSKRSAIAKQMQSNKSKVNENKANENKANENINIPFDNFWLLYDKKIGSRNKLLSKWAALTDEERTAIINYIPKYKKATPDKKYRKNPETFLNNKSWNDEIIETSSNGSEPTKYEPMKFKPGWDAFGELK